MYLTLNKIFAGCFGALMVFWVAQMNTPTVLMGITAGILAWALWRRPRWAYFVAAAWCFGMLRTAMDKENTLHQFDVAGVKHGLMAFYFLGMVIAIVLHEKVALKPSKPKDLSDPENQPPA